MRRGVRCVEINRCNVVEIIPHSNDLTDGLSLDYTLQGLHLAGAVTQHSYWVAHLAADLGWIDLAQFCLG